MPDETNHGLERLARSAVAIVGVGAGAAFTTFLGEPIFGAMAGQALAEVGNDIARRMLSPRQEIRVGTVLVLAAGALVAKETMGKKLRDDGFFEGTPSNAEEIIEGILLSAKDEYQEKKLPYLANMLAEIAIVHTIDVNTANRMIQEADRMTWLDMQILAIVARSEEFPLPEANLPNAASAWKDWTVFQAASNLRNDEARRLLSYPYREEPSRTGIKLFDLRMCAMKLSALGVLLVGTMELETISKAELKPVYESLLRVPPANELDGDDEST